MRVLVTGASGFVGFAVASLLVAEGHEVTALTRTDTADVPKGVARAVGDLRDREATRRALTGIEGVCHLAGLAKVRESFARPLDYWETNVAGTLAVLSGLLEATAPTRIVLASTCAVYGPQAVQPMTETTPLDPSSPYGTSKLAADRAAADLAVTGAIGATSLRAVNIAGTAYGRGDLDESRLIPKLLAVQQGRASEMVVNGDGSAVRDFVHVADMAAAFSLALAACEPGAWRAYNVGSGRRTKVSDVIAATESVTGQPVPVRRRPAANEPPEVLADSALIRAELGWQPKKSDLSEIVGDAWSALTCR
jgi:UDP-glucose 4-epimerase